MSKVDEIILGEITKEAWQKCKGRFITFEGIEGSGKTTQIDLLADALKKRGKDVYVTREPGGTDISERIRDLVLDPRNKRMYALTELLLFEASRAQHVLEFIWPHLAAGAYVLCDRFYDSTTAYQGNGRLLPPRIIELLHNLACGYLEPHLTVLIDVPVEEGLGRRREARAFDRIESEPLAFHNSVRQAFLELATLHPKRIIKFDGIQERGILHEEILTKVAALESPA